jgi:N-acetylglucosaminyldiphosphoundecaprenol N-acetyl-beta-D-mannosaminyltransferase
VRSISPAAEGTRALPEFPVRRILGRPVHDLDLAGAERWFRAALAGDRCRQVVTLNPEFVMAARSDPEFARAIEEADLSIPDGVGLILAGRRLGQPLRARVTGVDTVTRLAGWAAETGAGIYFLGAAPGVGAAAADRLRALHPDLPVAGTYPGSPADGEAPAILDRIRSSGARIVLVAFGAPAQDLWIARQRAALEVAGVRVAVGVGGAFDFISGRVPRAPGPIRRIGLEWLFRLIRQPWRWRRMLRLPLFAWLVIREPARSGRPGS